ncbi:PREDICTED: uncharacterized protein LOC108561471 [Nicrophorus vespilloides]|uniref:Uncharacterized protein LOC108561471 n=1 Tax=Nicrophorus vespilloides TaxID=110193 RepID=A0ABM1MK06_NICVS|nr:PREDICTED: uncharacterized protein LOC108561471 [Nicrophorus vespilloides]
MLLLMLLNLAALAKCNEDRIVDFVSSIICNSFDEFQTIFYISDGSSFTDYIHKSLQKDLTMVVVPPYENVLNYRPENFRAVGAIIATANLTYLNAILGEKSIGDFKMYPHYRILIFLQGVEADYKKYPFDFAQDIEALDLMIVQVETIEEFKSKRNFLIKLIYLNKDKVILEWNGEDELQLDVDDLNMLEWKPKDEYVFNVAAFNCPPYIYSTDKEAYDGIEFRIIQHIMRKFKVEYQIFTEKEREGRNESLYSIVKESVYNGSSDIAVCSHWMLSLGKYFSMYDTTFPYAQACITFLVPKPQPKPDSGFIFQPLQPTTWILMFTSSFTTTLILYGLGMYYKTVRNDPNPFANLVDSYLVIVRIFTLSGLNVFPKPSLRGIRIFLTCWSLNTLLLATAYAAGFTSALTSVQFSDPINTLQDMVNHNIFWGGPDLNTKAMLEGGNEIHRMIAKNYGIEPNNRYRDMRVRCNNYALIVKKLSQYYLTDTETLDSYAKTHMKILNECVGEFGIILILRKSSPFTKIFTEQITRLLEHGFIDYWYAKMMSNYNLDYLYNFFTSHTEATVSRPLRSSQLLGNFYLLLAGLTISALTFFIECLVKHYSRQQYYFNY